ncbi:MAG: DUF1611 domain-containing protein [Pseudomonadota bacterium]
MEDAILLAPYLLTTPNAKVTHGLLRHSERFAVRGVVDPDNAGRDAGELLDGKSRNVPVYASLSDALENRDPLPKWCVVGIATHGGRLTPELHDMLTEAATRGIGIVNGLHDAASDDPSIGAAAKSNGATIIDLRKPKPLNELHFWEGDILQVQAPRIAVIGTDCALGKRTTTRMLTNVLKDAGVNAEMIYTGQTGWMQGGRYGFVLDSTLNDFVSGELEHAIVTCDREQHPDVMLLEGQSALRNPSGPCGAELLLSAQARGAVIQHAPGRRYYEGYEEQGFEIPSLASEIDLIAHHGTQTLAVTLNGEGLSEAELLAKRDELADELNIPIVCPLIEGVGGLVDPIKQFLSEQPK